jgi:hypothetical protein
MDNDDDSLLRKRNLRAAIISIVLSIIGTVLPPCLALLGLVSPFVKHGRAATNEEYIVVVLCVFLFVILELVALVYAIVARRTMVGKLGLGISGTLLAVSVILAALVVSEVAQSWR